MSDSVSTDNVVAREPLHLGDIDVQDMYPDKHQMHATTTVDSPQNGERSPLRHAEENCEVRVKGVVQEQEYQDMLNPGNEESSPSHMVRLPRDEVLESRHKDSDTLNATSPRESAGVKKVETEDCVPEAADSSLLEDTMGSVANLADMPDDILLTITSHLSTRDVVNLHCTSKAFEVVRLTHKEWVVRAAEGGLQHIIKSAPPPGAKKLSGVEYVVHGMKVAIELEDLVVAIQEGEEEIFEYLVKQGGFTLHELRGDESNLFQKAGAHGRLNILKLLVEYGHTSQDVHAKSDEVMYRAGENGHIGVLIYLWNMSRKQMGRNRLEHWGAIRAAMRGDLDMVEFYRYAMVPWTLVFRSTLYAEAVHNGHKHIAHYVLNSPGDDTPEDTEKENRKQILSANSFSALRGACASGDMELVRMIGEMATLDDLRGLENSAIRVAARNGQVAVVEYLLGRGLTRKDLVQIPKETHISFYAPDAFHCAAQSGNVEIVRMLKAAYESSPGYENVVYRKWYGRPDYTHFKLNGCMAAACENPEVSVEMLRELHSLGADTACVFRGHLPGYGLCPNHSSKAVILPCSDCGGTICGHDCVNANVGLISAVEHGKLDVVQFLLDHCVPLGNKNIPLVTCQVVTNAARHGHRDIVKALLTWPGLTVSVDNDTDSVGAITHNDDCSSATTGMRTVCTSASSGTRYLLPRTTHMGQFLKAAAVSGDIATYEYLLEWWAAVDTTREARQYKAVRNRVKGINKSQYSTEMGDSVNPLVSACDNVIADLSVDAPPMCMAAKRRNAKESEASTSNEEARKDESHDSTVNSTPHGDVAAPTPPEIATVGTQTDAMDDAGELAKDDSSDGVESRALPSSYLWHSRQHVLYHAAENNRIEMVQYILQKYFSPDDWPGSDVYSVPHALLVASRDGNFELLKVIYEWTEEKLQAIEITEAAEAAWWKSQFKCLEYLRNKYLHRFGSCMRVFTPMKKKQRTYNSSWHP
eukprot:GFYU01004602.1.p1 GENE.GFYU01004602.1~~GFYU01004602.1.p1  ORF type:complete len:982 (-),score=220.24 GFYU01004602.1:150-3095(-)